MNTFLSDMKLRLFKKPEEVVFPPIPHPACLFNSLKKTALKTQAYALNSGP